MTEDANINEMSSTKDEHLSKGIIFILLGSISFATADVLGKFATQGYPLAEVIWFRSFFGLALIGAAIIATGNLAQFKSIRPVAHFKRSLAGMAMNSCMLVGLKYIPLAEVTALAFAAPMVIAIFSTLVLKEALGKNLLIAILVGFVGVLIVIRPTPNHFHFAHLVMLGFVLSSAYISVTARQLMKTETVLTLNFYLYPTNVIISGIFAWQAWITPDLISLAAMFGVALFATLALLSFTRAFHYASPARVMPFDYSRIIWTITFGLIIWQEIPDSLTWVGIAIIMICGLYIVTHSNKPASR